MKKDIPNSSANFLLLSSTGIKFVCPTAPKHPLSSRPHLVSQRRPQGDRAVTRILHAHHALPVTAHYAEHAYQRGQAGCSSLEAPPPQIHWDTHSATRESTVTRLITPRDPGGSNSTSESLHLAWPLPSRSRRNGRRSREDPIRRAATRGKGNTSQRKSTAAAQARGQRAHACSPFFSPGFSYLPQL